MKIAKLITCGLLMIAGLLTGMEAQADVLAPRPSRIKTVVKSGKGTISGAGTYKAGRTITLKATPASGYRFLHWGACCEDIDSKSSTLKYKVRESTTIYAYFKKKPTVVKPSAADGKSAEGVKLTWKKASGAVSYKIRRGKSSDYSKSVVIGETKGTSFMDYSCPEEANSKGKFYYWIMSVDSTGKAFGSKSKYDVGYPKNLSAIYGTSKLPIGASCQYMLSSNCTYRRPGKFSWKIVSGGTYATISTSGVLKGKKAGKVVISATYRGKTIKKTVTIASPTLASLYSKLDAQGDTRFWVIEDEDGWGDGCYRLECEECAYYYGTPPLSVTVGSSGSITIFGWLGSNYIYGTGKLNYVGTSSGMWKFTTTIDCSSGSTEWEIDLDFRVDGSSVVFYDGYAYECYY